MTIKDYHITVHTVAGNVIYPLMVVGILVSLIVISFVIVRVEFYKQREDPRSLEWMRCAVGAALPYVALVFVVADEQSEEFTKHVEIWLPTAMVYRTLVGAVTGIVVDVIGRIITRIQYEASQAIAAFFLSVLGAFDLYILMVVGLTGLQFFLFGLLMAVGIIFIVVGPPGRVDGL